MKIFPISRHGAFTSTIAKFLLCFIFITGLCFSKQSFGQVNSSKSLSPTEIVPRGIVPAGWMRYTWTDTLNYFTEKSSRSNQIDLVMQSYASVLDRYYKNVTFMPNSTYQLEYWIKAGCLKNHSLTNPKIRACIFRFRLVRSNEIQLL